MNVVATAPPDDPLRFEVPLYTLAESARLLEIPESTFSTWAQGYMRRFRDRPDVSAEPIVTATPAAERGGPRVPFAGLAEGHVVAALRRGLERTPRCPCSRSAGPLTYSAKRLFSEVIRDYLERIDYGEDDLWALRLHPPVSDQLIVDPHVAYGRPLIHGYGVPADAVLDRLRAGDGLEVVAEDFDVPPEIVEAVREALAAQEVKVVTRP